MINKISILKEIQSELEKWCDGSIGYLECLRNLENIIQLEENSCFTCLKRYLNSNK